MQVIYKYKWIKGARTLYDYANKHNHMITTKAEQRLKILKFWKKYGFKATKDAYDVSRSTLFEWKKIYKESGGELHSLNPGSQARINKNKRVVDPYILKEIKRLRLEVCPNMGKDKVKIFLDKYCKKNDIKTISASTIGRIVKVKKIYHQRQKVTHFGKVKVIKKSKKLRKPKEFVADEVGDLIEIDTIVRFDWGIKRYIITAVDVNTRFTFAHVYKNHGSQSTKDFFKKLEQIFPYKIKRVQTDNGSEFHKYFKDYLKKQKVIHFWNYKGQPTKNGHVEKYNRTIQEEFVDQNSVLLENTHKFNVKLTNWLIWYNTKRPHWSLSLLSPVQYLIKNNYLSRMMWTDTYS